MSWRVVLQGWKQRKNTVCQIRNFAASSEYNEPCAVGHCHSAEAPHRHEDRDTSFFPQNAHNSATSKSDEFSNWPP